MANDERTRFKDGYAFLGSIGGIPVHVHWTVPAVGIALSVYAGFNLLSAAYFTLAWFALMLVHELGHAVAVRAARTRVLAVYVSGAGGECRSESPPTWGAALGLAVGGLAAQALLLLATLAWVRLMGPPTGLFGRSVFQTFVFVNVFVFIVNAFPLALGNGRCTDGLLVWRLLRYRFAGGPMPLPVMRATRLFPEHTRLLDVAGMVPEGFRTGVQLLNDEKTPMDFVVHVLVTHLGMDRDHAVRTMFAIHNNGGALVPVPGIGEARDAAALVESSARAAGFPLSCRAVGDGA